MYVFNFLQGDPRPTYHFSLIFNFFPALMISYDIHTTIHRGYLLTNNAVSRAFPSFRLFLKFSHIHCNKKVYIDKL